jgi:hypothetical protein
VKKSNYTHIHVVRMLTIIFALAEHEGSMSLTVMPDTGHSPEPFPHNLFHKIHLNVTLPSQSRCCRSAFYKAFTYKYSVLIACLAILVFAF